MRRTDDGVDRTPGNTPPVDDLAHRQRSRFLQNLLICLAAVLFSGWAAIAYIPAEALLWLFGGVLVYSALCVLAGFMIRSFLRRTPGPLTGPFHPPAVDLSGECPAGTCRHPDACRCTGGGARGQ